MRPRTLLVLVCATAVLLEGCGSCAGADEAGAAADGGGGGGGVDPAALYRKGVDALMKQNDLDAANAFFEELIALQPGASASVERALNTYEAMQLVDLANSIQGDESASEEREKLYKNALDKTRGRLPHAWSQLGMMYAHQERWDEALTALRNAVSIDDSNINAWNSLGIVQRKLGHDSEAIDSYKKVLQVNPVHWEAMYNMGNLYSSQGQLGQAMSLWLTAIAERMNAAAPYFNLAVMLHEHGDWASMFPKKPLDPKKEVPNFTRPRSSVTRGADAGGIAGSLSDLPRKVADRMEFFSLTSARAAYDVAQQLRAAEYAQDNTAYGEDVGEPLALVYQWAEAAMSDTCTVKVEELDLPGVPPVNKLVTRAKPRVYEHIVQAIGVPAPENVLSEAPDEFGATVSAITVTADAADTPVYLSGPAGTIHTDKQAFLLSHGIFTPTDLAVPRLMMDTQNVTHAVSGMQMAAAGYHHWMLEGLCRVLLLADVLKADPELQLIVPSDRRAGYVAESLQLLLPWLTPERLVWYSQNKPIRITGSVRTVDWRWEGPCGAYTLPVNATAPQLATQVAMNAAGEVDAEDEELFQEPECPHFHNEFRVPQQCLHEVRGSFWEAVPATVTARDAGLSRSHPHIVFLSRAGSKARHAQNEAGMLRELKRQAEAWCSQESNECEQAYVDVFQAGSASLADTVAMFARANVIVGVHGGGLTNAVFCQPGAAVVELTLPEAAYNMYRNTALDLGLYYFAVSGIPANSFRSDVKLPAARAAAAAVEALKATVTGA